MGLSSGTPEEGVLADVGVNTQGVKNPEEGVQGPPLEMLGVGNVGTAHWVGGGVQRNPSPCVSVCIGGVSSSLPAWPSPPTAILGLALGPQAQYDPGYAALRHLTCAQHRAVAHCTPAE